MRKNIARKWVHLLLDLLPVLIIPIFAIYLINHEPQNIVIEREEYKQVDFNQLVTPKNIQYSATGVDFTYTGYSVEIVGTCTASNNIIGGTINLVEGHLYLISNYPQIMPISNQAVATYQLYGANVINVFIREDDTVNTAIGRALNSGAVDIRFRIENGRTYDTVFYPQVYDLTQMFGEGNEPSASNFKLLFPNDVYEYTLSEPMLVDIGTIAYNNTDIGSQFIYALYKPVNDYFNMTHLFNFGDIYTWINNSMFSGNAPLPIFIVYNVIVYEFLIDLIFLIYSIFMFIIDFTSELLARCFSFSNKGGTR